MGKIKSKHYYTTLHYLKMMKSLGIASLAALQAQALRQASTTGGSAYPYDGTTNAPVAARPYDNWIGKYKFEGATESFLNAMMRMDETTSGGLDGNIDFGHLVEAIKQSVPSMSDVDTEMLEQMNRDRGDLYPWWDDEEILAWVLPFAYDSNGDGMLNKEEARRFYSLLDRKQDVDSMFAEDAVLSADQIADSIYDMRYGGDQAGHQMEGMNHFLETLMNYDFNQDGVLTFREFLTFLEEFFNQPSPTDIATEETAFISLDIERMISECGGEACDWMQNDQVMGQVLSAGVQLDDYFSLYARMERLYMPWLADIALNVPATVADFEQVWSRIKYEPFINDAPIGWIPLYQRVVKTYGFEPSPQQIADYTQDQIMEVGETFD